MKQYIDKSVLMAEIKRLIDCCYKICAGNLDFLQKSYPEHYYSIETYKEILSFINTLEVKEVNSTDALIEKACNWLKENKDHPFIGCEDCCLSGFLTDEFIEEFRKAMKGE